VTTTDDARAVGRASRLGALDGLRGIAAAIVLVHHTLLLTSGISAVYFGGPPPEPGSLHWLLTYTPLKLTNAGGEAVIVFFVLSGLVLTLPILRNREFDWFAYYPRRIVRLVVPVIASVVLAALLISLLPQRPFQAGTTWLNTYSIPDLSWGNVVRGFDLLGGDFLVNNPLWSLHWELVFSLALPLFVVVAVWSRRWWPAVIVASCLVMWVGSIVGSPALTYLPVFLVGATIAVNLAGIDVLGRRIGRLRGTHAIWAGIFAASAMTLIASWLTGPLSAEFAPVTGALRALTPLAAGGLVVCALGWLPLARLLRSRPLLYLGKISFSLYLVHVPVLIFTSHALQALPQAVSMLVGVVLAFVIAIGFHWLVESRSHVWSRSSGAWVSRTMTRWHSASESPSTTRA
jgi:peptidoglycan/LPS O-acetylase OafA/YrhL